MTVQLPDICLESLHGYNPAMPEPQKPLPERMRDRCVPSDAPRAKPGDADKMMCERCGQAEMFRMHAVWRCPHCGYKTDCCGW
jgi:hypothetical protein